MRCLKHSGRFVFAFFVIIGMIAAGDKVRCGNLSGTLRRLLFPQDIASPAGAEAFLRKVSFEFFNADENV